ncbi:unnamed protein product [Malus baccata var. baccata]
MRNNISSPQKRKILFPTVASTVRSLITRSSSVARAAFLRPSSFSTPAKKPPIPALSFSLSSAAGSIHYSLFIKRRQMASESFKFGPYNIDSREVFYSTKLSYALVNLRPLVPGTFLLLLTLNNQSMKIGCRNCKFDDPTLLFRCRSYPFICFGYEFCFEIGE